MAVGSGHGEEGSSAQPPPVLDSDAANIVKRGSSATTRETPGDPVLRCGLSWVTPKRVPVCGVTHNTHPPEQIPSACTGDTSSQQNTPPTPLFGATSPPWCTLTQAVGCGQQQEQQEQQRAHGAGAELGVRAQGGGQTPCPPRRTRLRPPTTHIPVRPQPRGKQVGLVSLQSITLRLGACWVVC